MVVLACPQMIGIKGLVWVAISIREGGASVRPADTRREMYVGLIRCPVIINEAKIND